MSIKKKLSIIVPRETSGSDVYRRYDFQIACAMEIIIKLASTKKDFLALMDYLDDIVLIENPSTEAPIITFYQVKSKDNGKLTINSVLKNEWIEKMYYNLKNLEDDNAKSVLLSNTGISFGNGQIVDDIELVPLSDYLQQEKFTKIDEQILDTISNSFEVDRDQVNYDSIYLLRTNLTLNDYERQIKGELQSLANKIYPSLTAISLETIYLKVKNMLINRQACTYGKEAVRDYDTLCDKKGFSSQQLKEIINVTKDVQLPEAGEFKKFADDFGIKMTEFPNSLAFTNSYGKFSDALILFNTPLVEKLFSILDSYQADILKLKQDEIFDFCLAKLDTSDFNSTTFYSNYKSLIIILYLYKRSCIK